MEQTRLKNGSKVDVDVIEGGDPILEQTNVKNNSNIDVTEGNSYEEGDPGMHKVNNDFEV